MPKIKIDRELCKGCRLCLVNCHKGLIRVGTSLNKRGILPLEFFGDGCGGCGFCALVCPDGAIELQRAEDGG
ncbi:MAG: 4Fe-4S dicluster domain-containing protein [Candidatus Omnitrophota bacterium]